MWPWKRRPPPPAIPKFRPPPEPKPEPSAPIEVDYIDPGWSIKTMSMKIRKYWNIGE